LNNSKLALCSIEYKIKKIRDRNGRVVDSYPILYLFCRNPNGRRTIVQVDDFKPYFYVLRNIAPKLEQDLRDKGLFKKILDIKKNYPLNSTYGPVWKFICRLPTDVREIRNKFRYKYLEKIYEADILFPLRYLIDTDIKTGLEYNPVSRKIIRPINMPSILKYLVIDIEVLSDQVPNPIKAKSPVIVVGIYNSDTDSYTIHYLSNTKSTVDLAEYLKESKLIKTVTFSTERRLLTGLVNYIRNEEPDIIMTFTNFDMVYLINRMKIHGIDPRKLSPLWITRIFEGEEPRISGIQIFDISLAYRQVMGTPKWETLDAIAKRELGFGRIFHDLPIVNTWNEKDYWKVLVRNIVDVELTKLLNDKLGLLIYFDEIRRIAGCNLRDAFFPSRIADICYLRYCHNKCVLPTKAVKRKVPYAGAVVKEVMPGIYKNVLVLDFREMYPSIISSFNISFETLNEKGDIIIDDNHRFLSKPRGWAPSILEWLRPLLTKNKQEIQEAIKKKDWLLVKQLKAKRLGLKSIVHGIYGFFGFAGDWERRLPAARLYSPKVAESITYIGRVLQTEGLFPIVTKLGYNVLYADTDSVFLQLKTSSPLEESKWLREELSKRLRRFIVTKWKVTEPEIELDIDKIFSKLILKTKKRYAGKTIEGEFEVKGLEIVRADAADITVEVQKTLIEMILEDKSIREIKQYLNTIHRTFKDRPLEEIGIPAKLTKLRNSYKTFTLQLQAFMFATNYLNIDITEGERFYMVYVDTPPEPYNRISAELANGFKVRKVKVIGFKEGKQIEQYSINYEIQFQKVIVEKIKDILKLLNLDWKQIKGESLLTYV